MPRNIIVSQRGLGMYFNGASALPDNDTRTWPTRHNYLPHPATPQQRLADFATAHDPGTRLQQAVRRLRRRRKRLF